jgi:hypothetical protein
MVDPTTGGSTKALRYRAMAIRKSISIVLTTCVLTTGVIAVGEHPVAAVDFAAVECGPVSTSPQPAAAPLASFTAITPRRLVDTRNGTGAVGEPIEAGCVMRLRVGVADLPIDAAALALSLTALAAQPGYLSVFPCLSGVPATSNLNARSAGVPTPNLVVAMPDTAGEICIYSQVQTHLVIDVTGWWTDQGDQRFTSISPVRVEDSRKDPGRPLVPAGSVRAIDLSGVVPTGTTAVVATMTVTEPVADGYMAAFPCGTEAPDTSNLNFRAGESRAVAMVTGLDASAQLCVRSVVANHVIIDVSGYYSPAPQFGPAVELRPLAGRRLADSRSGQGGWTAKFGTGTIRKLRPDTGLGFDPQVTAAVLNVVATSAERPGYVNVYPCDAEVPLTSAVNFAPGGPSTNMVIVDLSSTGEVCFFASAGVHLVVDLFGVMTAPDDVLVERLGFDAFTWPPYTPDGTDYVVECHDGPVDLRLDLLTSTTARVNGVPVRSGTIDLPVDDDDLTWVQLRRGATIRNHWFRCVPDGFPRLDVDRPGDPGRGWYLTTLQTMSAAFAMILDERGAPVWYKRTPEAMLDLKRRSDGRLVMTPYLGPRYGVLPDAGYQIMSLAGTLVDEHLAIDDPLDPDVEYPTDHHDYVALANGSYALLTYPLLDGQDLSALGPGFSEEDVIADGVVQEIDAGGNLVWSWRTSDYVGYDEATFAQRWDPTPQYAGGEVDVFHLNSLAATDDGSGDYVVSARHLDAVLRIDRATGDLDWILGSSPPTTPNKSGAPRLTILNDPLGGPRRPHDARLTGDVLTLLDNRTATGQSARAVAYRIDEPAGTATLLWQISAPEASPSFGLGSNRVAADGSVLVGWGNPVQPMFSEYDAAREVVMTISQVGGGAAYRIVKEPPGSFSAAVLRANAGGTAEPP